MRVFWNRRNKRSEILEEIENDKAQPWGKKEPKSHVFVGDDRIFINPSDHKIDGYSLTTQDLEALLKLLRDKAPEEAEY